MSIDSSVSPDIVWSMDDQNFGFNLESVMMMCPAKVKVIVNRSEELLIGLFILQGVDSLRMLGILGTNLGILRSKVERLGFTSLWISLFEMQVFPVAFCFCSLSRAGDIVK